MSNEIENPQWFRVSVEIGNTNDDQPPLVAAVGWDLDMGHPRSERDIGDAVGRVLRAVNDLHGCGLSVALVLAEALKSVLDRETDAEEKALLAAAGRYVTSYAEGT